MGGNSQRLRIEVLGPLRAWRDGEPLALGPVRRQTVLAALLLRDGAVVSHEQLLDGVWGADPSICTSTSTRRRPGSCSAGWPT
ncbi:AfsR/SARP family transcriptional regulator [Streptomyces cellulosae]|nr:hypothetical protein OIE99_15380 [Streptomyces cellulosae]